MVFHAAKQLKVQAQLTMPPSAGYPGSCRFLEWRKLQPYLCGCNQDLSILGRAQIVNHAHELDGLRSRLLGLGHVQVHLVTVKVGVVRAAHTLIEAQRPAERSQEAVAAQLVRQTPFCCSMTPATQVLAAYFRAAATLAVNVHSALQLWRKASCPSMPSVVRAAAHLNW